MSENRIVENDRPALIELRALVVKNDRGETVFRDLSLDLIQGRSAVIVGSAGSGKTILAEVLIGRRSAEKGTVKLFGSLITPRRKRIVRKCRRQIGGVGGLFGLVPSLTVAENIAFPMVIAGERKKLQRERLRKMLSEFSLLKQAGEYPHRLTRVEVFLVQFARASITNQPLVIIDEPLAGLDKEMHERVSDYLTKNSISGRSMVILSSEQQLNTLPNTDHYVIEGGRLE